MLKICLDGDMPVLHGLDMVAERFHTAGRVLAELDDSPIPASSQLEMA
jgi:hypothetical protein